MKHRLAAAGAALALAATLAACGLAPPAAPRTAPTAPTAPPAASPAALPEASSGFVPRPARDFRRHAVAAAHPLAADAGLAVLRAGGNALDAAIATAFVLGVVEPQSSGIGGGALLLHWDGRRLRAWDGRETAPAAAGEDLFLGADGRLLSLREAQRSGRAVGVPGAVAAWAAAHAQGGRLPWARLLAPAIALAEEGVPIGPRLHRLLSETPTLREDPRAAALFFRPDGTPRAVGERVANPALAAVLRRIAAEGAAVMQQGAVAEDIVRRVRGHPQRPGALVAADLATYRAIEREPLCVDWRERWRVCGFPPPSSGGIAVAQMLGLWQALASALPAAADEAERLHRWAEVSRLAFADRAAYVADPAFVAAPGGDWSQLVQPAYLLGRASRVGPRSLGSAEPGLPLGAVMPQGRPAALLQPEPLGTTHLSVADGEGGVVALTSSIEAQFGAQIVSDGGTGLPGGFLLNNQLTDFAFAARNAQGRPQANRVQPGKRPRSSMSPTVVFDRGSNQPVLVLGSALGPFIIPAVARVIVDTLERGQDLGDALAAPLASSLGGPVTFVEAGRLDAAVLDGLRARGHTVQTQALASGLHALQRVPGSPGGWRAAADPRREGDVRGD